MQGKTLRVDLVSKMKLEGDRRHNVRCTYSRSTRSSIVGALRMPRMEDVGGTGSSTRVDRHAILVDHRKDLEAWLVESDFPFDEEKV